MKLENQVVSRDLSLKLKELGVKQESLFVWYRSNHSIMKSDVGKNFWYCSHKDNTSSWNTENISAFTVAELGEMLKGKTGVGLPWYTKEGWCWNVVEHTNVVEATEADARAKMLIYLLENKLTSSAS